MPDVMPASPLDARRLGQLEQHDTLAARNARLVGGDIVRMRVRRFDAELGRAEFQEFEVPYRKWMRVLDALNWIAENQAPDLAYRWFCGSKMCGTCAVRMNGREVLACWEAVEPVMTIEPLRNLAVVRDLVVDRSAYERKVESLEPWLERALPYSGFPEPLTHVDIKDVSKALDDLKKDNPELSPAEKNSETAAADIGENKPREAVGEQQKVLDALDQAIAGLRSSQGPRPSRWRARMPMIRFQALDVSGVPSIPWENRGTWGQAIELPAAG